MARDQIKPDEKSGRENRCHSRKPVASFMHERNEQAMSLETIRDVAHQGPFQPEWDSLAKYTIPSWYQEGKFGLFMHWGVYSVPAFHNEWYPRNMYQPGRAEFEHHVKTWGPHTAFGYKDFIPLFRCELYNPDEWASLFHESGARFVVPVAEHHDGFAMYHTDLSEWCAAKMGPKRDMMGELAAAVRRQGMVFGASSHRAEHYWFMDGGRKFDSDVQNPRFAGLYGDAQPAPNHHVYTRAEDGPSREFLEDWLRRCCEIVDRYQPQLVWFDWWINHVSYAPYLKLFAAYYYNRAAEWGKGVAINYKYTAFPEGTAVFDVERGQLAGIRPVLWQNDTSVSKNSWCHIEGQDYRTVTSLIQDLVDIVSKNGALLLNICPHSNGTIVEKEQQILREIGGWLRINGEAIYGAGYWRVFGEGPTEVKEGAFTDTHRQPFSGEDIRFTTKNGVLYALLMAWPGETALIRSLAPSAGHRGTVRTVSLLGCESSLAFEQTAEGLRVRLPASRPCDHVYTLKIEGENLVE